MRFLRKDINRKSRNGSYYFGASVSVTSSNSSNTNTTAPFEEKWLPARINEDGTYTVDLSAVYFTGDIVGRKDVIAFAESNFMSDGTTKGTLADLNDTNFTNLTEGQIIKWDGSKWINTDFQGGGINEEELLNFLTENNYIKNSDLGNYVTLDTEQHIRGMKWFDAVETVFSTKARVDGSKDSFENLPEFMFHIPNVAYTKFKMDSGGGLHLLNGGSTDFYNYADFYCRRICVGGSASQFLKADGSVDGTHYVNAAGDTMTGSLTIPMNNYLMGDYGIVAGSSGASTYIGNSAVKTLLFAGAGLYADVNGSRYPIWHSGNDGDLMRYRDGISSIDVLPNKMGTYWINTVGWTGGAVVFQNYGSNSGLAFYRPGGSNSIPQILCQVDSNGKWENKGTILTTNEGNAVSATKLQTSRTLWGRPFDGTASISGTLDYVGDINAEYYSLKRTSINSGGFYVADKNGNKRLLISMADSELCLANYTSGSWDAGITLREKGEIALAWLNKDYVTFNGSGSITFNQVNLQISVDADGYFFGAGGQTAAKNIHAGGLLVSNYWSDRTNIPTNGIYCKGNIVCASDVTAYSDGRLKSNIKSLNNRGFLNPVSYTKDGKQSIGFIAQEVREKYPELVMETNSEEKYLSLNYNGITAILEAQIIELSNKITELENKLNNGK